MTNEQKRFFLFAAILMGIVIVVSQIIFSSVFVTNNFPGRIISIVFVWLVTCASHYWVMKTVTNKPKAFIRVFTLQTTIRLLLYLTCIMVYIFFYRQHGVPFTVHFFIVYIIFAVFEVASILKFVKNNTGQTSDSIQKTS